MIQANELRVGNYICHTAQPNESIKVNWRILGLLESDSFKRVHLGIPLTPEILEKCGFNKCYESEWQVKYEIGTDRYYLTIVLKENRIMAIYGNEYLNDTKYLHQLQNLYFALTGEELNYEA